MAVSTRTTVRLPSDLLNRAKRKAQTGGRPLTSLLEEGLNIVLASGETRARKRRMSPPLSKATGGFMPRIDPVKFATQLQEEEDLDMLRRTGGKDAT